MYSSISDLKRPFVLQVDASDVGLGAVLSQVGDDGEEHPAAYASRKLFPRELKYATIEKEDLALKWAVQEFRVYLLGREFTVMSDHQSLQWMKGNMHNARVVGWLLSLQPYRFVVKHPLAS